MAGARSESSAVVSSEADPRGLRRPTFALLAVALQAAPGLPGGQLVALRHGLVVASGLLLVAWFVVNVRAATGVLRAALGVALLGAVMNLVVMVPNGGMPVAPAALEALGVGADDIDVADGNLYKHRLLDDDTVLAPLADVIPIRPLGVAASAGDAVLLVGLVGIVGTLVWPRRRTST